MSTLQVANLAFESTDNNQITFDTTTLNLIVGGANNIFYTNSTSTTIVLGSVFSGNNVSISNDSLTFTSNVDTNLLTANGRIIFSGNVTPTLLSANTSDWNPNLGNSYFIRVSSNADVVLSGMVEGANGQVVVLNNTGNNIITLASEDIDNENTASRRFLLPSNLNLYPSSSISLIYSITDSRWKTLNSISSDFYHRKTLTKGFLSGGTLPATPFYSSVTEVTDFSTETTVSAPGANLSQSRSSAGAAGNAKKGFVVGGTLPAPISSSAIADRITRSTETAAAVPGANLTTAKTPSSGGNSCKFFSVGGGTPLMCKTNLSSETTSIVGPGSFYYNLASLSNSYRTYYGGAYNAPLSRINTERVDHATETYSSVLTAFLTSARSSTTGLNNETKGFFSGGAVPTPTPTPISTVSCKLTFSTETTVASPGTSLLQAKGRAAGIGNNCKGFVVGGASPGVPSISCRLTFASETTVAVPGANLIQNRGSPVGV